jgi:hypothetical protein
MAEYKQPQTAPTDEASLVKGGNAMDELKIAIGGISKGVNAKGVKTSGIKQRGSGAATKGFTSRGPMA